MEIKKKNKHATLFLGVTVLQILLPFILSVCIFSIRVVQKELAANGDDKRLEQIIIPRHSVATMPVADGELTYKGVLYDIHSVKAEKDAYVILALKDDDETFLQKLISSDKDNGKQGYRTTKMFPFLFLYFEHYTQWRPERIKIIQQSAIPYERFVPLIFSRVASPPPRLC